MKKCFIIGLLLFTNYMFAQQPEKVLSYSNPYEAISQIINPIGKVTVGELLEQVTIHSLKK